LVSFSMERMRLSLSLHPQNSVIPPILDVATNLDTWDWSDDVFQSFTPLHDSLARYVSPIAPKQIKQVQAYGRGRALLPFLQQLEARDSLII
jgi:hypothetical protein